jgi:hypothetical protein
MLELTNIEFPVIINIQKTFDVLDFINLNILAKSENINLLYAYSFSPNTFSNYLEKDKFTEKLNYNTPIYVSIKICPNFVFDSNPKDNYPTTHYNPIFNDINNYFLLENIDYNGKLFSKDDLKFIYLEQTYKNCTSWNLYNNNTIVIDNWLKQCSAIATLGGIPVIYFRTIPSESVNTLKTHTIRDVSDIKKIFVNLVNGEIPHDRVMYTDWDMPLQDDFMVHIVCDIYQQAFGPNTVPNEKDYIFIPILNKLFRVSTSQPVNRFMGQIGWWEVFLAKFEDDESVHMNKELLNSKLSDDISELLGDKIIISEESKCPIDHIKDDGYLKGLDEIEDIIGYTTPTVKQTNIIDTNFHFGIIGPDNKLYFGSNKGIWFLDIKNNEIKQTNKTDKGFYFGIIGLDNKLYFTNNNVWFLDIDGQIKLTDKNTGRNFNFGIIGPNNVLYFCSLAVSGIWFLDTDGQIKVTNKNNGNFYSGIIGPDNVFYFSGISNNGIWFLDIDGQIKPTNLTTGNFRYGIIGPNNKLYFCSYNGIYFLDTDGQIKPTNLITGNFFNSIIGPNNKLYFCSYSGIYFLDIDEQIKVTNKTTSYFCSGIIGPNNILYFLSDSAGIWYLDTIDEKLKVTNKNDGRFNLGIIGPNNILYFCGNASNTGIWYLDIQPIYEKNKTDIEYTDYSEDFEDQNEEWNISKDELKAIQKQKELNNNQNVTIKKTQDFISAAVNSQEKLNTKEIFEKREATENFTNVDIDSTFGLSMKETDYLRSMYDRRLKIVSVNPDSSAFPINMYDLNQIETRVVALTYDLIEHTRKSQVITTISNQGFNLVFNFVLTNNFTGEIISFVNDYKLPVIILKVERNKLTINNIVNQQEIKIDHKIDKNELYQIQVIQKLQKYIIKIFKLVNKEKEEVFSQVYNINENSLLSNNTNITLHKMCLYGGSYYINDISLFISGNNIFTDKCRPILVYNQFTN